MLFKIICELFGNDFINSRLNLGISELALCLTLKLALGELNGDNRVDCLSNCLTAVTRKRFFFLAFFSGLFLFIFALLFKNLFCEIIYDFIQGTFKTKLVHTAFACINIIRE